MEYNEYTSLIVSNDQIIILYNRIRDLNIALLNKDKNIHGFYRLLINLPYEYVGLTELVDFIPLDERLCRCISFVEKRVLDDIYRVKPMIFGLIGLFDPNGEFEKSLLNSKIRFSTTQWYSWSIPVYLNLRSLVNYVFTFSRYAPSSYKPALLNFKWGLPPNHPLYFNDYAFSSSYSLQLINNEFKKLKYCSIRESILHVLMPPNYGLKVVYLDANIITDFFNKSYSHFEVADLIPKEVLNYSLIRDIQRVLLNDFITVVIPIILFCNDMRCSLGFLRINKSHFKIDDGCIYEADDFVIDLCGSYRGSKLKVYYSMYPHSNKASGFSMNIYINPYLHKIPPSRMYLDIRYGGKLIYSSSSRRGLLI